MAGNIRDKISEALSMPPEVTGDSVKIILESNNKAFIENYRGVSEYSRESICISTGRNIIAFKGTDMEIKSMTSVEIIIDGLIEAVNFS